jgi:hypothetical protein
MPPLVRTKRATSAPVVRAPLTKYVITKGKGAKIYKDPAGAKSSGGLLNGTIITIFGNTSGDKYPRIHSLKGKILTKKSWYIENKNVSNHPSMSDDLEPEPKSKPKHKPSVVSRRIRSRTPPSSKVPRRRSTRGPRDVALRKAWEAAKATPARVLSSIEEVGDDKESAGAVGMNKKNFKRNKTMKEKHKKRKSKKLTKQRRSKLE